MNNLLLLTRLILCGVFGVAGIAKLLDRPGTEAAMTGFGLSKSLARPAGLFLALIELVVALALLPSQSAWFGAIGGSILLIGFLVGVAVNLARGRRPDCHCFGQLYSKPIGRDTIARNLFLLILAIPIGALGPGRSGPSAIAWLGDLSPGAFIGALCVAATIGLLVTIVWQLRALRTQSTILAPVPAPIDVIQHADQARLSTGAPIRLPIGATAPLFRLADLQNNLLSLHSVLATGKPLFLIFSDVDCNACTQFLPEIAQWQRERSDITIAVVSRGTLAHNLAKGTAVGVTTLLVAADRELARSYGAYNTPSGILVSADGHIASDVAEGATAIRGLLESAFELAIQSTQGDTKDLIPPVAPFDGADRQAEASITTTPIGIQSRPKPHPEVATTELDGEAVVYDPRNGQVHQLNPTAALVWSLCDGELAVVDMAETIAEAYGIPTEDAAADIDELLTKFSSAGLLVLA